MKSADIRLMTLFEELVMTNLIKHLNEPFNIELEIEYFEATGQLSMTIVYDGEEFNPFEDGDELSMIIVGKRSTEHSYSYEGTNRITVAF